MGAEVISKNKEKKPLRKQGKVLDYVNNGWSREELLETKKGSYYNTRCVLDTVLGSRLKLR